MSQFSVVLNEIRKGMNGESLWIPMRHPSLSKNVGITKRLYHLIGGDPGSGKTAFVDQTYVLDAHDWASRHSDKVKIKTIYFSMERSKVYKKTKWLAYRLYTQNSILRSINDLLSFGTANHPMTDELISVAETHEEYFDNLFADVKVIDGSQNPTGILKSLYNFGLDHGIIYGRDENGRYYKTTKESWNRVQGERQIYIDASECPIQLAGAYDREYVPNDPKLILQVVCDHFGRINSEMGLNTKQTIDKASKILSDMRDLFGYSVVGVSQFNRNNANIQRRINTDLTPEQQDFKDSGNTYEDFK